MLSDVSEGTRSVSEIIKVTDEVLQSDDSELHGKKLNITENTLPEKEEDRVWNESISLSLQESGSLRKTIITEQEALDRVKAKYATNFSKVIREDGESYFYKLDFADYYLVSEGPEGERYYLIHLYEFVVDEEDTGIGHTVTYGWYAVDRRTGEIEERMVY